MFKKPDSGLWFAFLFRHQADPHDGDPATPWPQARIDGDKRRRRFGSVWLWHDLWASPGFGWCFHRLHVLSRPQGKGIWSGFFYLRRYDERSKTQQSCCRCSFSLGKAGKFLFSTTVFHFSTCFYCGDSTYTRQRSKVRKESKMGSRTQHWTPQSRFLNIYDVGLQSVLKSDLERKLHHSTVVLSGI